jgi:hypothetical protein
MQPQAAVPAQAFDPDHGLRWEDSPRRQLGDHPRARWRPPAKPPTQVGETSRRKPKNQPRPVTRQLDLRSSSVDDRDDDDAEDTACWPSLTGMRRGNPKKDYNENGTQKEAAPPVTTATISSAAPKKRKPSNDFGNNTFWNRPAAPKRKHTPNSNALMASTDPPYTTHDLIVDTGASHLLFREQHKDLLLNVQLSSPTQPPFAILRAANGQVLTAIGRGLFCIKHISVVAYIFRDTDLVHDLLGIAPFANLGCKAVFTATNFNLYHGRTLLLTGTRHNANLWHISVERPTSPTISQPALLSREDTQTLAPTLEQPALLLHEDTRKDGKYVQFIHACLGSPPPITFLHAV